MGFRRKPGNDGAALDGRNREVTGTPILTAVEKYGPHAYHFVYYAAPEGAVLAWGGPARRTLAPTLITSCIARLLEGFVPVWGGVPSGLSLWTR